MQAGAYVRCNFPFRETAGPGHSPHIVFCLATGRIRDERFAIVVYTTTRIAFPGGARPRQHLLVDESRAVALGQTKSFHIDVSRVARLPLSSDYFPTCTMESSRHSDWIARWSTQSFEGNAT